jgi:adenylate kinase family enzyme
VSQHPDERVIFEAVAKKPHEAEIFHDIHTWLGRPYIVFHINVSDELVHERSARRARDVVDSPRSVEKRLEEYTLHTLKSVETFRDRGVLVDIDGSRALMDVRDEIFSHLIKDSHAA